MLRIKRTAKVLRNNWKKSVFGAFVITYGGRKAKEKYECNIMMKNYCDEALKCGYASEKAGGIRKITVLLNPAANKRRAKKNFDKYCAPLLYLAGIQLDIVSTTYEGEASVLAEKLDETIDSVVVAGGNGTLAEAVTGLLRRCEGEKPFSKRIPIGVLPLGQTNTVAKTLFERSTKGHVALMAEATMAVIRENKKPLDVIKVEQLENENEQRPVYSVSGLEWGALYDVYLNRDKYWYWGALRSYMAYIFMGLKKEGKFVTSSCTADLTYSSPCSGCSRCYRDHEPVKERQSPVHWWTAFIPRPAFGGSREIASKVDYSKIVNVACGKENSMTISSVDFAVKTSTCSAKCDHSDDPHIEMIIGPSEVDYFDFISKGWEYISKGEPSYVTKLPIKDVKLHPVRDSETKQWFYIDNNSYEVKPIYLKLLPKKILMFCQL